MPPDCMTLGKWSWVLARPQPRACSSPWVVAPMTVPGAGGPHHPIFLVVPLVSVQEKPGIPWGGSWQCALAGRGLFPWGCGVLGLGRNRGGRMELPLGGQFQSAVWDEAVGKGDCTQPPFQGDVRESALQALEG